MMKDEEMQSVVAEAKRNRFATVPKLGDEGMVLIILGKGLLVLPGPHRLLPWPEYLHTINTRL